jgi:predicted  nucleic acid-binding Zn-ribbon protein
MGMDEIFEDLRALQEILSQRITLERDIHEEPKTLITKEEMLARLKRSFIEKNQEYEKVRSDVAEYRNLLLEAEGSREQSEKNMDSITTQREYEALDKEIRDASGREQHYRKELQQQERSLTDLDEQMKELASLIEQQEMDLAADRAGIESRVTEKSSRLAELVEQENALTQNLDPEVVFKFERIIRNKMGRGIVAIKSGVCTGCHMILPAQFANTVRMGEEIVFCPYCSRILFYEETEDGEEEFFNNEDAGSLSDLDDLDDEEYDDDEDEEEDNKSAINFEE